MSKRSRKAVRPPINGVVVPQKNRRMVQYRNVGQRGVVDPACADASSSAAPLTLNTDASGNGTYSMVFAPRGLNGVNPAGTANIVLSAPHLPWLYNVARNFLEYRVTRAHLIIVGNVGSTATGTVGVFTTTDMIDVFAPGTVNLGDVAVGGTTFALADLANNNKRIPMRIDSSWKKSTSVVSQLIAGNVLPNSSIDDLSFTGFIIRCSGGVASAGVLSAYIDYDVEFRGVAGTVTNV